MRFVSMYPETFTFHCKTKGKEKIFLSYCCPTQHQVGRDIGDDVRRCQIIREEIGYDRKLMVDANQVIFTA